MNVPSTVKKMRMSHSRPHRTFARGGSATATSGSGVAATSASDVRPWNRLEQYTGTAHLEFGAGEGEGRLARADREHTVAVADLQLAFEAEQHSRPAHRQVLATRRTWSPHLYAPQFELWPSGRPCLPTARWGLEVDHGRHCRVDRKNRAQFAHRYGFRGQTATDHVVGAAEDFDAGAAQVSVNLAGLHIETLPRTQRQIVQQQDPDHGGVGRISGRKTGDPAADHTAIEGCGHLGNERGAIVRGPLDELEEDLTRRRTAS